MFKIAGLHVFTRRVFLGFLDGEISPVTPVHVREGEREGEKEMNHEKVASYPGFPCVEFTSQLWRKISFSP